MHESLISELSLLTKQVLVATDDRLWTQLDMEVLGQCVYGEAHAVAPSRVYRLVWVATNHENLFVNFVTLLKDVLVLFVQPWL